MSKLSLDLGLFIEVSIDLNRSSELQARTHHLQAPERCSFSTLQPARGMERKKTDMYLFKVQPPLPPSTASTGLLVWASSPAHASNGVEFIGGAPLHLLRQQKVRYERTSFLYTGGRLAPW